MKLVHWSLVGGLLHLVQRGGDWAAVPPRCTSLCNSVLPLTTTVPLIVLLLVRCSAVLMCPLMD